MNEFEELSRQVEDMEPDSSEGAIEMLAYSVCAALAVCFLAWLAASYPVLG
jgi:hypothetical protein